LPSLAPAATAKGVSAASARPQPAFDQEDRSEYRGDDQQLDGPTTVDRRPDDKEHESHGEDHADDDLKKNTRA
jgi:hypothetical protein